MTIETNEIAKSVAVMLNFANTHRYQFVVEIPLRVENNYEACAMVGTSAAGKKFRLGDLALPIMMLLHELGHAESWETKEEEGHRWTLNDSSRRLKWRIPDNCDYFEIV